jgi:hypothetical protein
MSKNEFKVGDAVAVKGTTGEGPVLFVVGFGQDPQGKTLVRVEGTEMYYPDALEHDGKAPASMPSDKPDHLCYYDMLQQCIDSAKSIQGLPIPESEAKREIHLARIRDALHHLGSVLVEVAPELWCGDRDDVLRKNLPMIPRLY